MAEIRTDRERTTELAGQVDHVVVKVDGIARDVALLKAGQARTTADIADLKADVAELRADQGGPLDRLERDLAEIKATQRQIIDIMNENFAGLNRKFETLLSVLKVDKSAE